MSLQTLRAAPQMTSTSSRAPVVFRATVGRVAPRPRFAPVCSADPSNQASTTDPELESEADRKKREADKLRAAEKFMVVGDGSAKCGNCGYDYRPEKGDPDFPIAPGVRFEKLPEDYFCPTCGAPRKSFQSTAKVVAGFAENQGYGLGTNSMTGDQKALLIYGSLAVFFALFLAGYALD